ncbi:MAG: glutamate synthase large subunit, partial [Candidatus Dormiibacterota bacterium]
MSTPLSPRAPWPGTLPSHRAACGMGFVAAGRGPSHRVVELGVGALARLAHRGGLDADGRSGDGAGVLIQIPRALFGEQTAVAVLFAWDARARGLLAEAFAAEGVDIASWRRPPVAPESLVERARSLMPEILHALIPFPADVRSLDELELRLYRARRLAEREAERRGIAMYVPSSSARTIVYKGLMAGGSLAEFYGDLADEQTESQLIVFHQRYSTNTLPDWRLAQPMRMLAHNGEINTISGNRNWMRARDAELPRELRGAVWAGGSDSSSLDNVIELLCRRGAELGEAMMTIVPEAWEARDDVPAAVRDFHRFQSTRFEPWDGPAALAFSDGRIAGAALDRNGLRPLRYQVCRDGLVVAASEAGVVPMPPAEVVERGRLGPGELLLVDVETGQILRDAEAKLAVASTRDFGHLADRSLVPVAPRGEPMPVLPEIARRQRQHGWTAEDVKAVVQVMVETGAEPTFSMGDDTPIAPLGRIPRRLYGHLRQRFAQVTNPSIDSLRERSVMSLRTLLGARGATLAEADLLTPRTALIELASPLLGHGELASIRRRGEVLDATFPLGGTLAEGLDRLCTEAESTAAPILLLSDERAGRDRLPIPMLLAVGAVHERLLRAGLRLQRDVVAIAGDAVDVHDLACLITVGATAVHPYLALASARSLGEDDPEERYREALEHGLLKVMAKMGISCVSSYCGAEIVEALGLGAEVMACCLPGVPSRVGGADLAELEIRLRTWRDHAWGEDEPNARNPLDDAGRFRFRKSGEFHQNNPIAVRAGQKAAQTGEREDYDRWIELSTLDTPQDLRSLLRIEEAAEPLALEEVEPASDVRRRFISTAMSLGSVSPLVHETLAVAMNEMGGRSNSGEGGEDPATYGAVEGPRRDNRVKQIASARFGVTPEYVRQAEELEIKIAQGAKPGEGGQLPGIKVTELIARLRHAQPGQQLISPPPHHDIYSIEDLAELIHDLRAANPQARIGVKLVAEAGVGTIAAGVAKAHADYILISGHSGGTGAAPLGSIKNAGVPWELGLAETQQALLHHGMRERVTLRTDGGLRSGRDVVVA